MPGTVGQIERKTQQRVVKLICERSKSRSRNNAAP
jgi:hypothetical protein